MPQSPMSLLVGAIQEDYTEALQQRSQWLQQSLQQRHLKEHHQRQQEQSWQQKCIESEQMLKKLEGELVSLKQTVVVSLQQQTEELRKENEELRRKESQSVHGIQEGMQREQQLQQQLSLCHTELDARELQTKGLQRQVELCRRELEQMQHSYSMQSSRMQEENDTLASLLKETQTQFSKSEERGRDWERQLKAQQREAVGLHGSLERYESQMDHMKQQWDQCEADRKQEREGYRAQLKEQETRWRDRVKELEGSHGEQVGRYREEVLSLQQLVSTLEGEKKQLEMQRRLQALQQQQQQQQQHASDHGATSASTGDALAGTRAWTTVKQPSPTSHHHTDGGVNSSALAAPASVPATAPAAVDVELLQWTVQDLQGQLHRRSLDVASQSEQRQEILSRLEQRQKEWEAQELQWRTTCQELQRRVTLLEHNKSSLEHRLRSLTQETEFSSSSAGATVKALEKHVDHVKHETELQLKQKDEQLEQRHREVNELRGHLTTSQLRGTTLEAERKQLEQRVKLLEVDVETLQEALHLSETQTDRLQKDQLALHQEHGESQKEMNRLRHELQRREEQVQLLAVSLQSAEKLKDDLQKERDGLGEQLSHLTSEHTEVLSSMNSINEKRGALEEEVLSLRSQLNTMMTTSQAYHRGGSPNRSSQSMTGGRGEGSSAIPWDDREGEEETSLSSLALQRRVWDLQAQLASAKDQLRRARDRVAEAGSSTMPSAGDARKPPSSVGGGDATGESNASGPQVPPPRPGGGRRVMSQALQDALMLLHRDLPTANRT